MRNVFTLLILSFVAIGCTPAEDASQDVSSADPMAELATDAGESWFSSNASGTVMVFGRHGDGWSGHTIWGIERTQEGWSEAAVLPFSGTFNDRAARFYPGLDAMLFASDRPLPGETEVGDFNIWIAMHDGIAWLDPEPIPSINTDENDFHASISGDASIFFASDREGGQGGSDIFKAELGIEGYDVSPIASPVSSPYSEADVWADPALRYLIFSRTDDPDGFGGDDLWISFADGEGWDKPVNLGGNVNSAEYEYGPWVSRDGATLFYTTHKDGDADVLQIALADLGIDGPEGWTGTGIQ
jgi:hypothetical protein